MKEASWRRCCIFWTSTRTSTNNGEFECSAGGSNMYVISRTCTRKRSGTDLSIAYHRSGCPTSIVLDPATTVAIGAGDSRVECLGVYPQGVCFRLMDATLREKLSICLGSIRYPSRMAWLRHPTHNGQPPHTILCKNLTRLVLSAGCGRSKVSRELREYPNGRRYIRSHGGGIVVNTCLTADDCIASDFQAGASY